MIGEKASLGAHATMRFIVSGGFGILATPDLAERRRRLLMAIATVRPSSA